MCFAESRETIGVLEKNDKMVWGVIIALAFMCLLLFSLIRMKQGAEPSLLSWLMALIMTAGFSIEINSLISRFDEYSNDDDYVASVYACLEACLPYDLNDHHLSYEEAHLAAVALKTKMPTMSKYIQVAELEGKTPEVIADTLREVKKKAACRKIWNTIGWMVLTLVAGTAILSLSMGKGSVKTVKKTSSTPPSWKNDIDF